MISLVKILLEAKDAPKAVILAGAPGAGKSSIAGDIISGMGLSTLNIDDDFIKNLKDADVSLDLKNADAEDRSKSARAMQAAMKSYNDKLAQEIEQRKNIVIDGTAASYKKTEQLKDTLESAGYEVFMVYVYASLERSLKRNEERFERSGGKDRSLMPGIVMQTWANVTKNFIPYLNLFGEKFTATTTDKGLVDAQNLDDIIDKYIVPYTPKNTKPKTDKQKARSIENKKKTEEEISKLMSKEEVGNMVQQVVSAEEAQSKLKSFLTS